MSSCGLFGWAPVQKPKMAQFKRYKQWKYGFSPTGYVEILFQQLMEFKISWKFSVIQLIDSASFSTVLFSILL